jgi:choice-of-anchor B domain-containing protein
VAEFPSTLTGFGAAVVLTDDYLYVGHPGTVPAFPLPPNQKGIVHIFQRGTDGSWSEIASVTGDDTELADGFGSAIAVRGNLMVVGAPSHGTGGAAYVFTRAEDGMWSQARRMSAPNPGDGDAFGSAVGIGGNAILVAAPGSDSAKGTVYAFSRGSDNPAVVASGTEAGVRLGSALSLDGPRALIGAPGRIPLGGFGGGPPGFKTGSAAIYERREGGVWEQAATLDVGTDTVMAYGYAVHLAGNEAYVSSPLANRGRGVVYAFAQDGDAWPVKQKIQTASATGQQAFGFTFGVAGDRMLVGAPILQGGAGAVYTFDRNADGWTEKQKLSATSLGMGGFFGSSIGLGSDLAVVGGPMADFFEGTGYVYHRDAASGDWTASGTVVAPPTTVAAMTGGEVACADGKVGAFDCQDVSLLAYVPNADLGARRGIMVNDLWGWTDPDTDREYAIVGRMDGTTFLDVTDPSNPVYLGELPYHEGAHPNLWRDIKTYKNHAFIVSDGAGPHGMQVFDLTQLRNVTNPPRTFTETAHYGGMASAHNIVINEESGFAYTVGNSAGGETCGGALHMIDIRDPVHPTFAGCFGDPATGNARTGYTHDGQCVIYHGPDAKYKSHEVCFNASETAVGIADVTDKSAPTPIASAAYPNVGYSHQGWLSDDHQYFYLNDELDEIAGTTPKTRTLVWDVRVLEEPVLLTEFLGTTSSSDHNLYVRGNYMYQSNYVSGLRIIDIADPAHPKEVGYFDTVPMGGNTPGFAGSWSNYPFFKSGTILVSSMREGLFVLRHRPANLVP